jgi:putative transcription antitermination factor YqgF
VNKILSLDYGRKNIGISISDTTQSIAFLRPTIKNSPKGKLLIKDLIINENIKKILIGKNQNKNPNFNLNQEALDFLNSLQLDTSIKIISLNEDFTTFEAKERLMKAGYKDEEIQELKDSASAQILLEKYLQSIE